MAYHITGSIMAALFGLTIYGLWCQLEKILQKKKELLQDGKRAGSTNVISLNYYCTAFLAFYFMFFYGFALDRFNHYIVWPRFLAIVLTLLILRELWQDRKDSPSLKVLLFACISTVVSLMILAVDRNIAVGLQGFSALSLLIISFMMAQANTHQILLILRSGKTGSIALRTHQMTLVKDIGTVAFGLAMGNSGWPLIILCGSDALFKVGIIYLFIWVRTSDLAQHRRSLSQATP